jgi:hypothetical protein
MSPAAPASSAAFGRRAFLAGSAAGVALLVTGCGSSGDGAPAVTAQQVDQLAGQVAVQQALVAQFTAARAADPALGTQVADLADLAQRQLDRLKAAAPGPAASSSAAATAAVPPAGPDARAWLRTQIAAAADSHATACLDQTGGRAALLGSIAAGLRGQDGRLA